jgi:hypothetical protein
MPRMATHAPDGGLRANPAVELAATTFAILVLELALIRWIGTQIRIAAYFSNLVLVATFLGMGLGVGLGRRYPTLSRWGIPALALLSIVLASAGPLGLIQLKFPDPSLFLWGAQHQGTWLQFIGAAVVVTGCFWCVATIFMLLGARVGHLFGLLPPLRAYAVDLGGSLAGVLAMAVVAALWAPTPVWLALGILPLVWFHRDPLTIAAAVVTIAAGALSVDGAKFSPYNRIDLHQGIEPKFGPSPPGPPEWLLSVNRDYHQRMLNLGAENLDAWRANTRRVYELPFLVGTHAHRRAVVVGAGTGNDVAAALRVGYTEVVSIDIDPAILELGAQLHPEKPYSNPRAIRINDDARAYFSRPKDAERFDVVCFGLLDSHALLSSMSSLRLDNFVYTEEGLKSAWAHVADDGVLSVSFSMDAEWMYRRFVGLMIKATGMDPIIVPHRYDYALTFLAGRKLTLAQVQAQFPDAAQGEVVPQSLRIPSDDWPFLYLRPATVPWTYVTVFLLIALTGAYAVRRVFGRSVFSRGRFDPQMFLLGAAFLLLETRAVTQLSLLFGSTWVVNTSVFAGVLAMVLAANALAARWRPERMLPWYLLLAASLIGLWLLPTRALVELPLVMRGVAGGVAFAIPIFFAGIIFSSELRRRADSAAALGSNLCGAVVGGLLENLSMLLGLKAIALIALAMYLGSMQAGLRREAAVGLAPQAGDK